MGLILKYDPGQTAISEDEIEGLRTKSITTQDELNEAERLNIEQAIDWTLRRRFSAADVFTEKFITELHRRMYADVWKWAGSFRKSDKNIGVDWFTIPTQLRALLDDAIFWHDNETFSFDERAIRFKHRIVSIHCFPNGNGRHSRLIADVIASHVYKLPVFTWSAGYLQQKGHDRKQYLATLRQADAGDIKNLIQFARS